MKDGGARCRDSRGCRTIPISTASRIICFFVLVDETNAFLAVLQAAAEELRGEGRLAAPDRPITTVVLFSLTPPSNSGLSP